MVGKEVKDPPILLDVGLGVRLESMDHVWEFHSITDEKDREIVSHQVKIALCLRRMSQQEQPLQ